MLTVGSGIVAAAALGLTLLWLGWRGRRIDDHPLCRRCGFDLVGRGDPAAPCPECGADLGAPGTVRIGHRRRRPLLLALAGVILVPLLLAGGLGAWVSATGSDWNAIKPARLLAWELASRDVGPAELALAELERRRTDGTLSAKELAAMIDALLARQSDRSRGWAEAFGKAVEMRRGAGDVTEAQWQRYLLGAADVRVEFRPRIRAGAPVVAHCSITFDRLGPMFMAQPTTQSGLGRERGRYRLRLKEAWIDGEPVPEHEPGVWMPQTSQLAPGRGQPPTATLPPISEPGRRTIRTRWAAAAFNAQEPLPDVEVGWYPTRLTLGATEREVILEFEHEVEVFESPQPAVELTTDPAVDEWLARELRVECQHHRMPPDEHMVTLLIDLPRPPVDIAASVFIRAAGATDLSPEGPLMTIRARASGSETAYGWRMHGIGVTRASGVAGADSVDLFIRSEPLLAEETFDMERIWSGEIVIRDVPLERGKPFGVMTPSPPKLQRPEGVDR